MKIYSIQYIKSIIFFFSFSYINKILFILRQGIKIKINIFKFKNLFLLINRTLCTELVFLNKEKKKN